MTESFHAIYWPAFLMALDLPLPRQIFAHAHWTLGRRKMSKSRGNVVNPFFAIHRFGIDALRYFLALKGGVKDDAVYDNDLVSEQYEMDLKCGLGNLSSRIIRGKGWNVFHAVQQQKIPLDEDSLQLAQLLNELPSVVLDKIENQLDLGSALQSIMNVVRKVFPPFFPFTPNLLPLQDFYPQSHLFSKTTTSSSSAKIKPSQFSSLDKQIHATNIPLDPRQAKPR